MKYGRLPEFQTKKDDKGNQLINTVTISNSVLHADKVKEGEEVPVERFEFPASKMEFPQYESVAEFIASCETEERALEVINEVTEKFATASGKTAIRTASSGTLDEIIALGLSTARNFSWKKETKLTTKDKASKWDTLQAEIASGALTPDQIAARVMELNAA